MVGTVALTLAYVLATSTRTVPGQVLWIDVWLNNAVYAAGALACLVAALGRSRQEAVGWVLICAATTTTGLGNVVYSLVVAPVPDPPYPSWSDALYLVYYPLLWAGLVLLAAARIDRFPVSLLLDGLVAGLGVAAIAAALVLDPLLQAGSGRTAEVLTNLAYPLADVVLVVVVVGLVTVLRTRVGVSLALIAVSLVVTMVADVGYLLTTLTGPWVEGGWADVLYVLGVVAVAASTLRPSRRSAGPQAAEAVAVDRLAVLPVLSAAACLTLLLANQGGTFSIATTVLAALGIVAAGLRAVLTFRDLRALASLQLQVMTDELTGLANRRSLLERLHTELSRRDGRVVALALVDLDGFKEVNDSLGHAAGDELLVHVGRLMERVMPDGALLARLGGDEFAAVLPGAAGTCAHQVGEQMLTALSVPVLVSEVRLRVGGSVGVATARPGEVSRGELLRRADIAMYQAKSSTSRTGHAGSVVSWSGASGPDGTERLRLLDEVRDALDGADAHVLAGQPGRGGFEVHLQPQVVLGADPATAVVRGAEALVRWRRADGGLVGPDELLALVRRSGLLRRLASVVLDQALAACAQWWHQGSSTPVSVNLTTVDVQDLDLVAQLQAALARHRLPAEALVVELTEETLMSDPVRVREVLGGVRAIGVAVSLDDFGTGYSSLAYLRDLPVDELKLDRGFTLALLDDGPGAIIVRHTIAMAHDLGLRLVAEGIETDEVAAALAALGCDLGQGYLWARPQPVEDFLRWLGRRRADHESLVGR